MATITSILVKKRAAGKKSGCEHKYITVYTATRTVNCMACGASLDPFDVLLDLTRGYFPAIPSRDEEGALAREISRRKKEKKSDTPVDQD